MEISKEDKKRIKALASEGKNIADIWAQFRKIYAAADYVDIYWVVYGSGGQSALGVKRTITNRINELVDLRSGNKRRFDEVVDELQQLVNHLYGEHKRNRDKLAKIREALGE